MARPWFPFYPADYLAKTGSLTTELHGAYMLLLMAYWANGGPLEDDNDELAAICRMQPEAFQKARKRLQRLFQVEGGFWSNKRMDEEIAKTVALIEQKSAAGKRSAQRRGNTRSTPVEHPLNTCTNETATQGVTERQPTTTTTTTTSIDKDKNEIDLDFGHDGMASALKPRFDTVRGGAKRFAGIGERPFKPKNPGNADADLVKHLATHEGMAVEAAWLLVQAARDPASEDHIDAARQCEKISRKHKIGWYHMEAAE